MTQATERQAVGKKKPRGIVYILPELCKGCEFCVEFCPPKMLRVSEEFNSKGYHPPEVIDMELCTGCDLCTMLCPELSIWAVKIAVKIKE